jgi:hypothetical protein
VIPVLLGLDERFLLAAPLLIRMREMPYIARPVPLFCFIESPKKLST